MARTELTDAEYAALKKKVLKRDGWKCRNPRCKRRSNLHVHHIIFRSQQGPDTMGNLVTICNDCHDRIHVALTLEILAKSGDPNDEPDADIGLQFKPI